MPRLPPTRAGVALAMLAAAASGCVGQSWSNDDHVGPTSVRPDPREHTLQVPGPEVRPVGTPAHAALPHRRGAGRQE